MSKRRYDIKQPDDFDLDLDDHDEFGIHPTRVARDSRRVSRNSSNDDEGGGRFRGTRRRDSGRDERRRESRLSAAPDNMTISPKGLGSRSMSPGRTESMESARSRTGFVRSSGSASADRALRPGARAEGSPLRSFAPNNRRERPNPGKPAMPGNKPKPQPEQQVGLPDGRPSRFEAPRRHEPGARLDVTRQQDRPVRQDARRSQVSTSRSHSVPGERHWGERQGSAQGIPHVRKMPERRLNQPAAPESDERT